MVGAQMMEGTMGADENLAQPPSDRFNEALVDSATPHRKESR